MAEWRPHKDKVLAAAHSAFHAQGAGRPSLRFRSPDLREVPIKSARLTGSPQRSGAGKLFAGRDKRCVSGRGQPHSKTMRQEQRIKKCGDFLERG